VTKVRLFGAKLGVMCDEMPEKGVLSHLFCDGIGAF
jgi:hypothetical protein